MADLIVKGYITDEGELRVELPQGIPSGEVQVAISRQPKSTSSDETWTDEELDGLFDFKAKSGKAIAEFIESLPDNPWKKMGITDSQAWVEDQRRKAAERRKLPKW